MATVSQILKAAHAFEARFGVHPNRVYLGMVELEAVKFATNYKNTVRKMMGAQVNFGAIDNMMVIPVDLRSWCEVGFVPGGDVRTRENTIG